MGANVLMIMPGSSSTSGASQGSGSVATLTPQDCEAMATGYAPLWKAVAPVARARTQIVFGNRNWVPNQVYGTTPAFLTIRGWTRMAAGQAFTDRDVLASNRVCLLGQTTAKELFQGKPPIGQEIRVNNVPLRVVGILARKAPT